MADFTPQQIEQFLQEFFDVVGTRQYTGARYVPIFGRAGSDTVEWDDLAPYEPLTVVMHQGVSYVSRRYVPTGIQITDTAYWVETYRFNAQVEAYRQEVLSFQGQIDQLRGDMESDYVPFPNPDTYPKYGILGQVLTTLTNGETKWEDPVTVDATVAEPIIEAWLDDHPEATTTVEDGSLTFEKLGTDLVKRLVHASNTHINASSQATWPFADANNQPNNSIAYIQSNVTASIFPNLPYYGSTCMLVKLNFSSATNDGYVQFAIYPSAAYVRFAGNSPSSWQQIDNAAIDQRPLLKSGNFVISASNMDRWPFADANSQPNNTTYYIQDNVLESNFPNLPLYGYNAIITKINYSGTNTDGCYQLYISSNSKTFIRFKTNSFTTWKELTYPYKDGQFLGSGDFHISMSNIDSWPFANADDQPKNTVYWLESNLTESDFPNLPTYGTFGQLIRINAFTTQAPGSSQFFIADKDIYFRRRMGTWSAWRKISVPTVEFNTNLRTCRIFKKVVCCGDSYTSGHIQAPTKQETNEAYAWPHYMESITGNTYVNCGAAGATTLSWLTNARGLTKAQASGTAQAYIIGLMINDINQHVPIGTVDDMSDENPTTFYGGMAKIIRELHAISSGAHIFIQTCPSSDTRYIAYNAAVREIVDTYASTYKTHLLDLVNYKDLYTNTSLTQDYIAAHYTALGYEQFAEILSIVISDYINTHVSDFQDVYLLPYA